MVARLATSIFLTAAMAAQAAKRNTEPEADTPGPSRPSESVAETDGQALEQNWTLEDEAEDDDATNAEQKGVPFSAPSRRCSCSVALFTAIMCRASLTTCGAPEYRRTVSQLVWAI